MNDYDTLTSQALAIFGHDSDSAYQEGFQDALKCCVDALVEGGDINYLLEFIANNAWRETVAALDTYYENRAN